MLNELQAWTFDELAQGNFEKAYRICKATYHQKLKQDVWADYQQALKNLRAAEDYFNEAIDTRNIDEAITSLNSALKQVDMRKNAIRKGASSTSPNS